MKYEYHLTISRTDRIWLIVFVSLLLGWELVKPLLPSGHREHIHVDFSFASDTFHGTESFAETNAYPKRPYYGKRYDRDEIHFGEDGVDHAKVPVDIMKASWKDLRAIGFQSKVASNIERYISAGGIIENESQLFKIYGMDSIQWAIVAPYVLFPEAKEESSGFNSYKNENTDAELKNIDINKATAADLESLPGIGTILAERIIKYRNSLGGFISVSQVGECYGMPPETLEKILPKLSTTQGPTLISINKVDLKNFSHPYLSRKMIRILEAYRAQHGRLYSAADLRKVYPPDSTWCDKLLPYLVFDE